MSQARPRGFTIVELLVVVTLVAMLAAILVPSLRRVGDEARLASCKSQQAGLHRALWSYAAASQLRLPPFLFSSAAAPDLALSGHWGGASRADDPDAFCRFGAESVNLQVLLDARLAAREQLLCPAAPAPVRTGGASYFPHTDRFSTYCLRFPPSEELFAAAPQLANRGGTLLGVYRMAAGGQQVRVGASYQTVPQVRADRAYRTPGGEVDVAADALLADGFWTPTAAMAGPLPVWRGATHEERINVLRGDGSVHEATLAPPGPSSAAAASTDPADEDHSLQAEALWRSLDGK